MCSFGEALPADPNALPSNPLDGGELTPFMSEGVVGILISRDEKRVESLLLGLRGCLLQLSGRRVGPYPLFGMEKGSWPIQWSKDGQMLYARQGHTSVQIYQVNLSTGERSLWKTIVPADPAGLVSPAVLVLCSEECTYPPLKISPKISRSKPPRDCRARCNCQNLRRIGFVREWACICAMRGKAPH